MELTTDEKRDNLRRLARYLREGVDPHLFDMSTYRRAEECGTVACALGHAPEALGTEMPRLGDWITYSEHRLIEALSVYEGLRVFNWMFGAGWACVDNTPEGAAARIEWYLDHGVPHDSGDQVSGFAPLCYV